MKRLHDIAVAPFHMSQRRPALFGALTGLVADLVGASMTCELWINGSFLTEKLEPNDIDLSFVMKSMDFEALDVSSQSAIVNQLNGGKKYSPLLDTYICIQFAESDPRRAADKSAYWAYKWGVGWDDYLKGFAVLRLGESDVGNRLFA
jgi:hypothetical protein